MRQAITNLFNQADQARREDRLNDARRDLIKAMALCRRAGSPNDLVRALKSLGQIERDLGRGEAALALYEEAVSRCRAIGDSRLLAHTIRHVGDAHQDTGRLNEAERCYDEALALYRSDTSTPALELANAIRPLAMLRSKTGALDEAMRLFAEAKDLYAKADIAAGVAECEERMARIGD